jgi:hypothetical protein
LQDLLCAAAATSRKNLLTMKQGDTLGKRGVEGMEALRDTL